MLLATATPDVERQLEPNNEDAITELPSSFAESVTAGDAVQRRILGWIVSRRVVTTHIEALHDARVLGCHLGACDALDSR